MRIEFDPTNPDEAAAVRAMLTAMHPTAPRYDPTARSATFIAEEKVHSEDGGMTVNLTDGNITVASDTTTVPDLDSNGEPWDARIHSTPAKTNADGTWRAKRGVKAEEIAAVRAERTAPVGRIDDMTDGEMSEDRSEENPNAGVPAQEQIAPPAPNAPVGEQEIPTAEDPDDLKHVVADPIVTAPPAPPAPIVQPEPVVGVAPSFLDVMKAITAAQKYGKIDTAKVKELCAAVGAGESTMGLNGPDNGDKRGAFMALLASETEGA